jgi:hypothetical protein
VEVHDPRRIGFAEAHGAAEQQPVIRTHRCGAGWMERWISDPPSP